MISTKYNQSSARSGFALLMTLIVVSVVISIGLTLVELTIKQLQLSTSSRDSEVAFHAANAGVECIRYWRLASSTEFETGIGDTVPMNCFGVGVSPITITDLSPAGPELIFQYDVEFNWGTPARCSKISMVTLSSEPTSAGVVLNNVPGYIEGYPETDKTCIPGGRCTIISVEGYNRACNKITEIGTIQREVLLKL